MTFRFRESRWSTAAVIAVSVIAASVIIVLGERDAAASTDLYVHCELGRDGNAGTLDAPLRTIRSAMSRTLHAGDTVFLARGCSWEGPVTVHGTGTVAEPITLTAYGTGSDPRLTGASLTRTQVVLRLAGAYIEASMLHIAHAAGIGIDLSGGHNAIVDTEIDDVGFGVTFSAPFGVAERVNVHDLHMMVNTPGGSDDHGAVGFGVQAPDAEIAYSRCTNCRAKSYDFGFDGGFVEIWNYGDRLLVHNSTGQNTQGILEIGGSVDDASAQDIVLRNNTFNASHGGVWIHGQGRFAVHVAEVTMVTNTISVTSNADSAILGGDLSNLTFLGNKVSTPGRVAASGPPASHTCNTFRVSTPTAVGYSVDATEAVVTDAASVARLPAACDPIVG